MTPAERIAQLEAENAWLRAELGLSQDLDRHERLRQAFGLSTGQACLVLALHGARGRPLSLLQIDERIPAKIGRADRQLGYVRVLVYQTRRKIGREAIGSLVRAYHLTPSGLVTVDQALGDQMRSAA